MALPKRKPPERRYDLTGASEPGNGLGRPAPSYNMRNAIGVCAIKDPWSPTGERTRAAVNVRRSLLEWELSHDQITQHQFNAGKRAEEKFERATQGPGSSNWQGGSRVDVALQADQAVARNVLKAQELHAYLQWVRGLLGKEDTQLLVEILRDRKTYKQVAVARLQLSERDVSYFARRFRDALETLAEAEAAKGKHYGGHSAAGAGTP